MATSKPRITVTLDPSVHAVLRELSEMNGDSMSRIVSELIESVAPVLERVVVTGRAFQRAQGQLKGEVASMVTDAESALLPSLETLQEEFMRAMGAIDAALVDGEDPRPVTRGSGPPYPPASPPSPQGQES